MGNIKDFYTGKKVFITGCTGFKGSWMCSVLIELGATIVGYSLKPLENELFDILKLKKKIKYINGDIRNYKKLYSAISSFKPDIIIHLAAQPLVIDSYQNPKYTYEVNVIGTVNLFEAIRICKFKHNISVLNVTTDKVYLNKEIDYMYKENDKLNGGDPYSNSKSCSELVTSSYKKSFFNDTNISISTCRSGNVIGGGDFSKNRILPDCAKYSYKKSCIIIRNPNSIRPYQHVLEPTLFYLKLCMEQFLDKKYSGEYNIGPNDGGTTTINLVKKFCKNWKDSFFKIENNNNCWVEANILKLDTSKIKKYFNWKTFFNIDESVIMSAEWYKLYYKNLDINDIMNGQILKAIKKVDNIEK